MLKQGKIVTDGNTEYHVDVVLKTGGGQSCSAYVSDREAGKRYFLKELLSDKYDGTPRAQRFMKERRMIYDAINRHTLPGASCQYTYNFFTDGPFYYVVTEPYSGFEMNPEELVKKVSPSERISLACAITYSLFPFEFENVVHADLKPQNILLVPKEDHLVVKLIDLESSFVVGSAPEKGMIIGSTEYYSPELFLYNNENNNYGQEILTTKSDIFSLGLILYEMMEGESYAEKHRPKLPCELAIEGRLPAMPSSWPSGLRLLLSRMLSLHPEQRPTLSEVLCELKKLSMSTMLSQRNPEPEVLIDRHANTAWVTLYNYSKGSRMQYSLNGSGFVDYIQPFMIDDDNVELSIRYEGNTSTFKKILNVSPYIVEKRVSIPKVECTIKDDYSRMVNIKCDTKGAIVKYTIDGSEPSRHNGVEYKGRFDVKKGTKVNAVALKWCFLNSDVARKTVL